MSQYMNEDEFVERLKQTISPNVKKISEVDWSTVSQEALDNDSFAVGEPFYLVAPQDAWAEIWQMPQVHMFCNCLDYQGNPIPNCTPKEPYYPIRVSLCIDIHNPTDYNFKHGRACANQGDSWYQLSCFAPCP